MFDFAVDIMPEGYYEIEYSDCTYSVRREKKPDESLPDFFRHCSPYNFVVSYHNEQAKIYICLRSGFAWKSGFEELKEWADFSFGSWSYKIVPDFSYCLKTAETKKKFFTASEAAEFLEYCRSRIIGQDRELRKAVYLIIEYAESVMSEDFSNVKNWMITAPSGSGKTEFFRSVRDYFKMKKISIPVLMYDLSQITATGYTGSDITDLAAMIASHGSDGRGIFFLDEADKKFMPDLCGRGGDFNLLSQNTLLSFIEGMETGTGKDKKGTVIDSSKTMFVFMGAFQDIRDKKSENIRSEKNRIGFAAEDTFGCEEKAEEKFYENVTLDEMIEHGLTEQLAGRISQVINFHKIDRQDMRELIRSKADEISGKTGISICITDKAVDDLLEISYTPLGIRAVINKINQLVSDVMTDAYFDDTFDRLFDNIVITSGSKATAITSHAMMNSTYPV